MTTTDEKVAPEDHPDPPEPGAPQDGAEAAIVAETPAIAEALRLSALRTVHEELAALGFVAIAWQDVAGHILVEEETTREPRFTVVDINTDDEQQASTTEVRPVALRMQQEAIRIQQERSKD